VPVGAYRANGKEQS